MSLGASPGRIAAALALSSVLAAAHSSAGAAPAHRLSFGQHTAQLCVATTTGTPNCGPAQADLRRDGTVSVRVDDIVYLLTLHQTRLDVMLMHNKTLIDDFKAPYDWVGDVLRFSDDERNARYEVRFDANKVSQRKQPTSKQ